MEGKEQALQALEERMQATDFWQDKVAAQRTIQEYNDLKAEIEGGDRYASNAAVLTIFAGAGGDDAEDFVRILLDMYYKYIALHGWTTYLLHAHEADHGGYRTVTIEIGGKGVYGELKNESGVHRLVRISPFNSSKKRHTSFAMVEVVPKFEALTEQTLPEDELRIEFAKSGGAGGQNVNKRETAVRIVHEPTNISVNISSERSQAQNKERALALLSGKLYHVRQERRKKEEQGLSVSATVSAEWGSQIRSYVFHPYQMVKDHRTGVEVRDVDKVLAGGLEEFIEAETGL
jgi:peptide chain release factor 2